MQNSLAQNRKTRRGQRATSASHPRRRPVRLGTGVAGAGASRVLGESAAHTCSEAAPLPPILTLHRLTETGEGAAPCPPLPGGAQAPLAGRGGAGVALRAGPTLLSDRQSDHRSPGLSSLGRPVSSARSASFPRRGFLSVSSRARQTKELLMGPFVSVDWALGPVRRWANWP